MKSKQQVRSEAGAMRRGVLPEELARDSAAIQARLLALPEIVAARALFVYVSYRQEVQTHDLIRQLWALGKIVAVPKALASPQMEAHRIDAWDQLAVDGLGIPTPRATQPFLEPLDVCLAPGLAFSPRGARLGYGRGHYDHFLQSRPEMLAIGLALECQIVADLPSEPHDRPMDLIVTPRRTIVCR